MAVLTKSAMVERLYEEMGLNKREAKELVEMLFEEVRSRLAANETVRLSGFGNFELRDKGSRPGRNPKTGEKVPVAPRRVVTFRPGQKLKAQVEAAHPPPRRRRAAAAKEPLAFGAAYDADYDAARDVKGSRRDG